MIARWLYHVVLRDEWERARAAAAEGAYWPGSASREGFIHASYRGAVLESARLYFPAGSVRLIVRVDPRLLAEPPRVVETPRGPMPHLYAPVPWGAVAEEYDAEEEGVAGRIAAAPDEI